MNLSVIVPVYNMADGGKLTHCMDSLLAQTEQELEIIAVDDCSTDASLEVLRTYEKKAPDRVRVIASDRNRRQGGAKNLGLAAARGEWIGFIDADDWVAPDYYERLLTAAREAGADMAGCDYSLVDHYTFEVGQIIRNGRPEQAGVLDDEKRRSLLRDAGSLVVKIYRRHIVYGDLDPLRDESLADTAPNTPAAAPRSVPVFPEGIFYEDNAVSQTWMLRARCYAYLPEPLYYYYQHDASTVHTVTRANLEDRVTSARLMLSAARENSALTRFRPEIEASFTQLFYVNTMFSALQSRQRIPGLCGFLRRLRNEQWETFPTFLDNPYVREQLTPEETREIRLHRRSQPLFLMYYRALWAYRRLRGAA